MIVAIKLFMLLLTLSASVLFGLLAVRGHAHGTVTPPAMGRWGTIEDVQRAEKPFEFFTVLGVYAIASLALFAVSVAIFTGHIDVIKQFEERAQRINRTPVVEEP